MASQGLDVEIFVVDNASVDGSVRMVREKYPDIQCIANQDNVGFAKANNQAIRISKGEYILLLNPDTIVETDTFSKVIQFMDAHPDAGGLGVKMVDGTGRFLPESKRGLPTPIVAFYKIFGFARLFPKSKIFNRYHLGFLDNSKLHEIDILAGAFMLMRKSVLDITGLLDEAFFMYGEDIDLSYRITRAGFKNYYFPDTRIIHYKGESTKKGSLNYVFVFYNAMIIFARKHFSSKNARIFSFLINIAIYFRAFLSIVGRVFKNILLPFADTALLYAGLAAIARIWEKSVIYPWGGHYPLAVYLIALPALTAVWIINIYFSGGYDRPVNFWKSYRGLASGTILFLIIYALLPEHLRFSRLLILTGTIWGAFALAFDRMLLHLARIPGFKLGASKNRNFGIVGQIKEAQRVAELLQKAYSKPGFVGLISNNPLINDKSEFIGSIAQIKDIINIYRIDEIIFCSRDMPAEDIIDQMSALQNNQVEYKIAPPESMSIIGSNSINTAGDLYVIDINSIGKFQNKRSKRLFDLATGFVLLITFPFVAFITGHPITLLKNIIRILIGIKAVSGYHPVDQNDHKLPHIKPGIIYPTDIIDIQHIDTETISRLNMLYARDYRISNEFKLLYKGFKKLGRKTE